MIILFCMIATVFLNVTIWTTRDPIVKLLCILAWGVVALFAVMMYRRQEQKMKGYRMLAVDKARELIEIIEILKEEKCITAMAEMKIKATNTDHILNRDLIIDNYKLDK